MNRPSPLPGEVPVSSRRTKRSKIRSWSAAGIVGPLLWTVAITSAPFPHTATSTGMPVGSVPERVRHQVRQDLLDAPGVAERGDALVDRRVHDRVGDHGVGVVDHFKGDDPEIEGTRWRPRGCPRR